MLAIPLDDPVLKCEKGEVVAESYIRARMHPCSALAHEDIACTHTLAAVFFDAQTLAVTVAPVLGSALSFFMCHDKLAGYGFNFDDGEFLTMAALFLVLLAAFLFENDDFFVTFVLEDGRVDAGAVHEGRAKASFRAFAEAEDFLDGDRVARLRILIAIHLEDVALGDGKLASLGFDYGFHGC